MQTTKSSLLAKAALALGLGRMDKMPPATISPEAEYVTPRRGRSRTPGPRRPAGSKLARMASVRRIGIGHKG
jgi:hypothetical protein